MYLAQQGCFRRRFGLRPIFYTYATKQKLKSLQPFLLCLRRCRKRNNGKRYAKMADLLQTKGLTPPQILVTVLKGEKHNEKQWNTEFPAFYEWVMGWD
jgi:hypothetical protein